MESGKGGTGAYHLEDQALTIPVFAPATQPDVSARVGDTFSLDLNATGNPTPTYSATNLPGGVTINSTTGVLSGTFDTIQTRTTTVTAMNSEGEATVTIGFTIEAAALGAPVISPRTVDAQVYRINVPITPFTPFTVTGNPTPTWSATNLPTGLSINATTGAITGTPTVEQSATNATITASNGVNPDDSVTISFAVEAGALTAPVISPRTVDGQVYPINVQIAPFTPFTVTGNPTPTWSATNLPTGLQINATTGEITGTPTVEQTGTDATITATNGVSPDDSVTISFAVTTGTAPQFGSFANQTLNINTPYDLTLTATGDPTPVITQVVDAPERQPEVNDIDLGGALAGWQGAFRLGSYMYFVQAGSTVLRAHNLNGGREDLQDITVSYTSPSWNGGVATSDRIFLVDNALGMAVAFDHNGTRLSDDDIAIGGGNWEGASINQAGDRLYFLNNSTDVIQVYDNTGARQMLEDIDLPGGNYRSIVVIGHLAYVTIRGSTTVKAYDLNDTPAEGNDFDSGYDRLYGAVYASDQRTIYFIDDRRDEARAFSDGSNLPDDLNFTNGVIRGTPLVTQPATDVMFRASNGIGTPAELTLSFTVQTSGTAPIITTATTERVLVQNTEYTLNLQATGTTPIRWSVVGGTLPTDVTLNETTGVVSGTAPNIQEATDV